MHFEPANIYHLYNYAIDRKNLFFNKNNYHFFLKKVRNEWLPFCDVLSYSLLPDKFNFLLVPNDQGCKHLTLKEKELHLQYLSKAIGKTLSSYTRAVNIQQGRSGMMFRKKTRAKEIYASSPDHIKTDIVLTSVQYIHHSPVRAGFVKKPVLWEFSSSQEYSGIRKQTICNKSLLQEITGSSQLGLTSNEGVIHHEFVSRLFEKPLMSFP